MPSGTYGPTNTQIPNHGGLGLQKPIVQNERLRLAQLSRRGWAWEFLRRNPNYIADFQSGLDRATATNWGLLYFADPALNASEADVFWHWPDCPEVLPMAICAKLLTTDVTLDFAGLACKIILMENPALQRRDILFRQEGRFLQLAIFGEGDLKGAHLVVSALDGPAPIMARTAALRRLNDLLFYKTMRKPLYPALSRGHRLATVLIALDGWLGGLSQQDIALRMYGEARVERRWNDAGQNLRDQVRRAIISGQELMNGGYRQFLRLTLARQIAATHSALRF